MNNDDYIVKVYVEGEAKNIANGKNFKFPIIPRKGDYIDLKVPIDKVNRPNSYEVSVYQVEKVLLYESGDNISAILHIKSDSPLEEL